MAEELKPRLARLRWPLAVAAATVAVTLLFRSLELALRDTSHATGWTLLALSLLLLAFGLRKKLPHPPLLAADQWLSLHLGAGVVAVAVFLCHLRGWPEGRLEWLLFGLFALTVLSGMFGWLLSRTVPRALTALGEEVIYERIPILCREIGERAQQLVAGAAAESSRSILGEIFSLKLAAHFAVPMPWWRKFAARARSNRGLHELRNNRRYLSPAERKAAGELEQLIRRRAVLDTHQAWQGLLKGWLLVHLPLAGALLIVVGLHLLLVQAFSGARP